MGLVTVEPRLEIRERAKIEQRLAEHGQLLERQAVETREENR